jgi:hypothetical protein
MMKLQALSHGALAYGALGRLTTICRPHEDDAMGGFINDFIEFG